MRTLIAVATAVAFLVSCGGSSDDTASSSTSEAAATSAPTTATSPPDSTTEAAPTSTTIEATTTAPVDPVVLAGQRYIELVTPLNCSLSIVAVTEAAIGDSDGFFYEDDWPEIQALQPAYAIHAQNQLTMMDGLITFDGWPDNVQADIDALIGELADVARFYQTLADATSFEQWASPEFPGGNAASVVRSKLGLETNIGTTRDFCADLE